jgi:hypothetical protein
MVFRRIVDPQLHQREQIFAAGAGHVAKEIAKASDEQRRKASVGLDAGGAGFVPGSRVRPEGPAHFARLDRPAATVVGAVGIPLAPRHQHPVRAARLTEIRRVGVSALPGEFEVRGNDRGRRRDLGQVELDQRTVDLVGGRAGGPPAGAQNVLQSLVPLTDGGRGVGEAAANVGIRIARIALHAVAQFEAADPHTGTHRRERGRAGPGRPRSVRALHPRPPVVGRTPTEARQSDVIADRCLLRAAVVDDVGECRVGRNLILASQRRLVATDLQWRIRRYRRRAGAGVKVVWLCGGRRGNGQPYQHHHQQSIEHITALARARPRPLAVARAMFPT